MKKSIVLALIIFALTGCKDTPTDPEPNQGHIDDPSKTTLTVTVKINGVPGFVEGAFVQIARNSNELLDDKYFLEGSTDTSGSINFGEVIPTGTDERYYYKVEYVSDNTYNDGGLLEVFEGKDNVLNSILN